MNTAIFALMLGALSFAPAQLTALDMGTMIDKAGATAEPSQTQQTSGLVDELTKSLGVNSSQAAGGTAALLNEAKSNMSSEDFSGLLSAVPDLSSIMESAGGFESILGKSDLSLADQFSSLGMDSDMIGKFTSKLLEYVQSAGGTKAMNLLKGALL